MTVAFLPRDDPVAADGRAVLREVLAGVGAATGLVSVSIVHPALGERVEWVSDRSAESHAVRQEVAGGGRLTGWIDHEEPTPREVGALAGLAGVAAGLARSVDEQRRRLSAERRRERGRLADELHDGPLQLLFAAELEINAVDADHARLERAQARLAAARDALRALLERLDVVEQDAGALLAVAIASVERTFGTPVTLNCPARALTALHALSADRAAVVARVVHEGAVNACKHGRASRVQAAVNVTSGGDCLVVAVTDDGFGPATSGGPSHGLPSLRRSLAECGGSLRLHGRLQGGTLVLATMPL